MFLSENLNVETRTPRLALSAESGQLSGAMEYGWVEPQSVWQAVTGIHNYADTLFKVRKMDHTGLLVLRILHDVR